MKKERVLGLLFVMASSALYGLSPLVVTSLTECGAHYSSIMLFKGGIAAAELALISLLTGQRMRLSRVENRSMILMGLLRVVGDWSCNLNSLYFSVVCNIVVLCFVPRSDWATRSSKSALNNVWNSPVHLECGGETVFYSRTNLRYRICNHVCLLPSGTEKTADWQCVPYGFFYV